MNGLSFLKTMELLGLFPSKTFERQMEKSLVTNGNNPHHRGTVIFGPHKSRL